MTKQFSPKTIFCLLGMALDFELLLRRKKNQTEPMFASIAAGSIGA